MVGWGNSKLSEDMYKEGYHNIINMDISKVVIDKMKTRNKTWASMVWDQMDVTDMTYQNEWFDIVLDKSTIDTLLWGDNDIYMVAKMMKEVQRVLIPGGKYLAISYGKPDNRTYHFRREHLDFELTQHKITYKIYDKKTEEHEDNAHYIYVWSKGPNADTAATRWARVEENLISSINDSCKKKWWKTLFCIKQ